MKPMPKKSGLEVDTVILSPMSHAGYYPGGKVMTMKVVFEKKDVSFAWCSDYWI